MLHRVFKSWSRLTLGRAAREPRGPRAPTPGATARPAAPTSQLLPAQRTLVFAFTGMETSVRYSDVHFTTLVGSRVTAGKGTIQAFCVALFKNA